MNWRSLLGYDVWKRWRRRSNRMDRTTEELIEFVELVAVRCDLWAQQSETYGWSTHQVEDNRHLAEQCRRSGETARAAYR
jgi:hypothetical protein